MKLLLDTHVLIWAMSAPEKLGDQVRLAIEDSNNDVLVSIASLWEVAIKQRLGKLEVDLSGMLAAIRQAEFRVLGIAAEHLLALVDPPMHHRDPFDRLLIAQAMVEDAAFISGDRVISRYPVRLLRFSD